MSRPNIIMIMTDQHRGDFMGCMGSEIVATPHLDRMAEEGVLFTRAYCNSPLCVPSRMSMLAGTYPSQTQVFENSDYLRSDMPTIAHAMSLGGYDTVLCGRMHFVGPDQRHGYQKRLVGDITSSYPGGPSTPYGKLTGTAGQGLKSIRNAGPGTSPVIQYDEQVTQACEQFLNDHQEADRPFFLTVGYYGPHHPYVCPEPYYDAALAAIESDKDRLIPKDDEMQHSWLESWRKRLKADEISDEQLKKARACYAGLVSLMDQHVGRVLKAAEAQSRDTIIIYTSDHGDMAGDRGMFWKRNFYEGAVRVPMIWKEHSGNNASTKRIAKSLRVDVPVSLIDLAPTFSRIGEAPSLPQAAGEDLCGLLANALNDAYRVRWSARPFYCELATKQDTAIRVVIRGQMKLVAFHDSREMLMFDLERDPMERHNVIRDPAYAVFKEELEALVEQEWDSSEIVRSINLKQQEQQFMKTWAEQVGMGKLDLWDYEAE
ncbi:sulfatase-like hydrolase/transferase [Paenibacillus chungangensis]|uniref:Sulfatase-like hydrolase/transferase n=1 Tax=Paenibacillus chungangensis TaxID=696535 RepID=A0ABW3HLB1_9BACL